MKCDSQCHSEKKCVFFRL